MQKSLNGTKLFFNLKLTIWTLFLPAKTQLLEKKSQKGTFAPLEYFDVNH